MHRSQLLLPPGSRIPLLGNEAIARGVIEAGIRVVCGYPGTPSSEVIMSLAPISRDLGIYAEWAVNEKVAFEIALGAAFAGIRAMATMKAPGLNVALDAIASAAYSGVNGGLLIYVADDPGPHTTQTEQDSRWIAELTKIPMIEPSTPQEAKEFVKLGVKLSEKVKLPIFLRCTTRVSHTTGIVEFGDIEEISRKPQFEKDIERYVRASMIGNKLRHKQLLEILPQVSRYATELGLNRVEGDGTTAVVTSGVAYNYVYEVLKNNHLLHHVKIIKLGLVYPLPEELLYNELKDVDRVLVIEELDPYIEIKLRAFLHRRGLDIEVHGKDLGIPEYGELDPHTVSLALSKFLNKSIEIPMNTTPLTINVPPRPPPLCPGCPHRFSYIAILKAIERAGYRRDEVPIIGDIGCYALSYEPPLEAIWVEHAMGSSIGIALGLKISGYDKPVIATIGDSTFFHAGIPPTIEAVHKGIDIIIVILDNGTVAMTGHQSTPAWSRTESGRETQSIDLVNVIRGLGIDNVEVVDPRDLDRATEVMIRALRSKGVRVVIMKAPCALQQARKQGLLGTIPKIDLEKCRGCLRCITDTGCPALTYEEKNGKRYPKILEEFCTGCGLCVKICPFNAMIT